MGCSNSTEATIFPQKSIESIPNIKTYNMLRSNAKLTDTVSENIHISPEPPTQQQLSLAAETLTHHQFFSALSTKEIETIVREMIVGWA
jgi:hypothetical protein